MPPRIKLRHRSLGIPEAALRVLFVREFVKDFDITAAMRRCGQVGSDVQIYSKGYNILRSPDVRNDIARSVQDRADKLEIAADDIARYWYALATADARELCPVTVAPCRHCYGIDHQYQFTLDEMRRKSTAHFLAQKRKSEQYRVPFDELGGDGYTIDKPPNLDCPECFGKGVAHAIPIDLKKISHGAAMLFDGYKINKDGSVDVKIRNRSEAMLALSRMLGVDAPKNPVLDPRMLTEEQLDAAIRSIQERKLAKDQVIDQ